MADPFLFAQKRIKKNSIGRWRLRAFTPERSAFVRQLFFGKKHWLLKVDLRWSAEKPVRPCISCSAGPAGFGGAERLALFMPMHFLSDQKMHVKKSEKDKLHRLITSLPLNHQQPADVRQIFFGKNVRFRALIARSEQKIQAGSYCVPRGTLSDSYFIN